MIDVEVRGVSLAAGELSAAEMRRLCVLTAEHVGLHSGHVAVQFVTAARIAALNRQHRGLAQGTDVLSFPVDGLAPLGDERTRELGDIVICPQHTADLREALIHAMLHLLGMDHERDSGEMLAMQDELLALARR